MKLLRVLFVLLIGYPLGVNGQSFMSKHVKPVTVRILSDDNGLIQEEHFICNAKTCCFSEEYYCFMDAGRCICDIYACGEGTGQKPYWIEITGTLALKYCFNPRLVHQLTGLCLCDPAKKPPCGRCNPPPDPTPLHDGCSPWNSDCPPAPPLVKRKIPRYSCPPLLNKGCHAPSGRGCVTPI